MESFLHPAQSRCIAWSVVARRPHRHRGRHRGRRPRGPWVVRWRGRRLNTSVLRKPWQQQGYVPYLTILILVCGHGPGDFVVLFRCFMGAVPLWHLPGGLDKSTAGG